MIRTSKIQTALGVAVLVGAVLMGACSDTGTSVAPTPGAKPNVPGVAPAAAVPSAPAVTILKWGPQGTKAGVGFLVQKTGNSALWFEQRGIHSAPSVEVWFDQTRLPGMAIKPDEGGSAEVPADLLAKPGKYPVYLKLLPGGSVWTWGSSRSLLEPR
jgi:hypothetical protein